MKLPKVLVGTDEFYDLLVNGDVFVDKSLMVEELLEDSGKVILIARPRRFGKSLNMDMLRKFFEIEVDSQGKPLPLEKKVNHKLFVGGEIDLGLASGKKKLLNALKVAQCVDIISDYQGRHPVIYINFKDVKGNSYTEVENGVRNQIIKLFADYRYLEQYLTENAGFLNNAEKKKLSLYCTGKLNIEDLKDSLGFLSKLLYKHFKQKVYLLIDEYDTPINSSYLKFRKESEAFEQVLELFRGLFGNSLKSNPYLEKGVMTGILRVAKANLFSDLNNVKEYTLLDERFSKFYGFTQEEVDALLAKVPTASTPEKIREWYNGYTFGKEVIYNPWSIMLCLSEKGRLDHYWLDSGGTGLVDHALLSDEMQEDLQNLAAGKTIVSPITKQISFSDINTKTGLFSLLLFSGYLNPVSKKLEENIYELSVPNKEVSHIYNSRILRWVTDQLQIDSSRYYSFVSLLPNSRIEEFKGKLQELLLNATSFYQTGEKKAELFYSGFMLGLINMLSPDYIIESEKESGKGRSDIILTPKPDRLEPAIIIEYKIAKATKELKDIAQAGLAQINEKQYDIKIKEHKHVQKIIKISMAFCGKEMALEYQVDNNI